MSLRFYLFILFKYCEIYECIYILKLWMYLLAYYGVTNKCYDRMNHSHIFYTLVTLGTSKRQFSLDVFHSNWKSENNDTVHILHVPSDLFVSEFASHSLVQKRFDDKYRHTRSYDRKPICFLAFQRSPSLQIPPTPVFYPFILQFFSLRSLGIFCIKRCEKRLGGGVKLKI